MEALENFVQFMEEAAAAGHPGLEGMWRVIIYLHENIIHPQTRAFQPFEAFTTIPLNYQAFARTAYRWLRMHIRHRTIRTALMEIGYTKPGLVDGLRSPEGGLAKHELNIIRRRNKRNQPDQTFIPRIDSGIEFFLTAGALQYLSSTPVADATIADIPRTKEAMKRHVAVMVRAIQDMDHRLAGDAHQVAIVKFTSPRVLEAIAWDFMFCSIDAAEGRPNVYPWATSFFHKEYPSWESRWDDMLILVQTSKAAVANVLLCPYIQRFANDPDHELKRKVDNKDTNLNKASQLSDLKAMVPDINSVANPAAALVSAAARGPADSLALLPLPHPNAGPPAQDDGRATWPTAQLVSRRGSTPPIATEEPRQHHTPLGRSQPTGSVLSHGRSRYMMTIDGLVLRSPVIGMDSTSPARPATPASRSRQRVARPSSVEREAFGCAPSNQLPIAKYPQPHRAQHAPVDAPSDYNNTISHHGEAHSTTYIPFAQYAGPCANPYITFTPQLTLNTTPSGIRQHSSSSDPPIPLSTSTARQSAAPIQPINTPPWNGSLPERSLLERDVTAPMGNAANEFHGLGSCQGMNPGSYEAAEGYGDANGLFYSHAANSEATVVDFGQASHEFEDAGVATPSGASGMPMGGYDPFGTNAIDGKWNQCGRNFEESNSEVGRAANSGIVAGHPVGDLFANATTETCSNNMNGQNSVDDGQQKIGIWGAAIVDGHSANNTHGSVARPIPNHGNQGVNSGEVVGAGHSTEGVDGDWNEVALAALNNDESLGWLVSSSESSGRKRKRGDDDEEEEEPHAQRPRQR
ncbi:hypothetical protein B0T13DRAFT_394562 [Neurospora crassa]|nr:hypothetical protein B0T13DRAFT_394562 [Neurospora crassa]